MSPIENVVPLGINEHSQNNNNNNNNELRNKQDRSRELYGVQLEVMLSRYTKTVGF